MVPLIRFTVVTVPVSACWANVTELMTISIKPAKTIFASLIEISRLFRTVDDKPESADWFPDGHPMGQKDAGFLVGNFKMGHRADGNATRRGVRLRFVQPSRA